MAQPPPGILGGGPPSAPQQQPIIGEPFIPGQSSIKTRDILYRLVISQLFYDGYQQVAVALSNIGEMSISFLEHILSLYLLSSPHRPTVPPIGQADASAHPGLGERGGGGQQDPQQGGGNAWTWP